MATIVRSEAIYNLAEMGADMGDLMAKYNGNKTIVLAARNANAGLLVGEPINCADVTPEIFRDCSD